MTHFITIVGTRYRELSVMWIIVGLIMVAGVGALVVYLNRVLGFEIDPVLEIGRPARPLQQRLDTTNLDRIPVAVECVARQPHDLTRLRDVAEFFRQIEKAGFVFDDLFITLKDEGYISMCFDG